MPNEPAPRRPELQWAASGAVRLHGILGQALDANHRGRLSTFIVDENSPAVAIFHPAQALNNESGDWYGEHAGKWLYAAAKAASRTHDAQLGARVRRVADFLVGLQDDQGYVGNYAPSHRFTHQQPPKLATWDGAPAVRTWDIWTHSYLMLGLLEVHRHFATKAHLDAAQRIGDLCWRTLTRGAIDITDLGNHHGMSATVLMDPALELHFETGEQRYLDLALLVLEQAERHPRLALLTQALSDADASEIATGKAYQLLWNMVGLAKLHRATGTASYLDAVLRVWQNVAEHHLTLGGGPWGGVAQRSREVFNPAAVFSPHGYVETCSTLAWIQLNRELLSITGSAMYAEEIERSAYNDLLGAQAPDGKDWCYYSFPNGRRLYTTEWRCCKSSGAMALEEVSSVAYGIGSDGGIRVNVLGPADATLNLAGIGSVLLEQRTSYPFDGSVEIRVVPERCASFRIHVRVPAWAESASLSVNGACVAASPIAGSYACIDREWSANDTIVLTLPMRPRTHRKCNRSVQESLAPDGSRVSQEVLAFEYLAISRGPLVYATGLIDGYKVDETMRIDDGPADGWLETVPAAVGDEGLEILLHPVGRPALIFAPYYRAGGRRDRTWRLTWMALAPALK